MDVQDETVCRKRQGQVTIPVPDAIPHIAAAYLTRKLGNVFEGLKQRFTPVFDENHAICLR
jgi:hypothetical protein